MFHLKMFRLLKSRMFKIGWNTPWHVFMSTPRCFNRHTSMLIFNYIICSFGLKPRPVWAISLWSQLLMGLLCVMAPRQTLHPTLLFGLHGVTLLNMKPCGDDWWNETLFIPWFRICMYDCMYMWCESMQIQFKEEGVFFLEFLQWIQTICIHSWNILKCTNIPKHSIIYRRDATMLDVKNWDPWILLFLPWGSLQRQASKRYSPPFWPWIWPWVFQKRPTSCCQLLMS